MIEEVTEDYENKIKENKMLKKELAASKAEVERLKYKLMEANDMMDCQSATIRRLGTGFHNAK